MTTRTNAHHKLDRKITQINAAISSELKSANTKAKKPRNKITYTAAPLPNEGVVRLPSVIAVLGISKTSFLDGVKVGKFPAGKLLSPRCRVWPVAEIRALLASLETGEAA